MKVVGDLFSLAGRSALVTGASGDIGRAIATGFASAGARVYLGARSAEAIAPVLESLQNAGADVRPWIADLRDETACSEAMARIAEDGGIDILVNCAGIIVRGSFDEHQAERWDEVLAVNMTAPFTLIRHAARAMGEKGWGRILNIGSALSIQGKANALSYVATKHGLAGITRALAAELGPHGICVNALCPGYVITEITQSLQRDSAYHAKIIAETPLRRWCEPSEMVGPALFLCSDASSYVNGHLLVVDGGMTATH